MSVFLIILGLLLFVGLVVVHEFGHFIAARRNGVEVEEFGIGFPPQAWHRRLKSGLLFTINWLPLGGFVRLKGEHDSSTVKGSFGAASLSTKVKIMLAGVGMNLLTAFVLLTGLALVGMPKLIDNQFTVQRDTKVTHNEVLVGYIEDDSPAAKAGLQQRDRLVTIKTDTKNVPITEAGDLPAVTKELAGQQIKLTIERGGKEQVLEPTLRSSKEVGDSQKTDQPKGYLGISPTEYTLRRSTWSAPVVAVGVIGQFTKMTLQALGGAVVGLVRGQAAEASSQVAGPVGIFVLIKDGSLLGYQFILMIIAVISLTLALMNVLPIPALDGGRLFVTLLYRALRRPLTNKVEDRIHGTGFALLMLLFVVITIVDIKRFF